VERKKIMAYSAAAFNNCQKGGLPAKNMENRWRKAKESRP